MSLILEALQKSEHERAVGRVPGLDSTVVIAHALSLRRWKVATILVVLVNVFAVAGYFLYQEFLSKPKVIDASPGPISTAPTGNPDDALTVAPNRASRNDAAEASISFAPTVTVLEPTARGDSATTSESDAAGVHDIDAVRDIESSRLARQRQTESAPAVAAASSRTVTESPATDTQTDVLALPSTGESKSPDLTPAQLPVLAQVRESFSPPLAPLRLDVHVYSPTLNERFVLINMNKYHEGDRLREGPQITAIESTGVVMEYQDQKFVLTAD